MSSTNDSLSDSSCCTHGGIRAGCGRKPGVKTTPIRLPQWLISQLEAHGDPKKLIIDACKTIYELECEPCIDHQVDQKEECK